jgi:hypothetical protein
VINEFHKANLAVLNLGPNPGIFISGAHAMNELVRPASVILSHVNEPATEGGKLRPTSQTARLIKQLKAPAHLAISGRTMEFDPRASASRVADSGQRGHTSCHHVGVRYCIIHSASLLDS